MSSTVKEMVIRSIRPELCKQRLINGSKYVDQYNNLFDLMSRKSRLPSQVFRRTRAVVSGIATLKPKRSQPRGHQRAQAILSPVSDPTAPTTNKVYY